MRVFTIDCQFSWNDFLTVSSVCLQTLAVQQRHWRPRLEAPQRLHAAALLQIQQLDQDNRVDLQQAAAAARPNSTASSSSATTGAATGSTAM